MAELRAAQAQVAEAKSQVRVIRIELGEQPGRASVGGEELHDRVEVQFIGTTANRGLRLAIGQELSSDGGGEEGHSQASVEAE